MKKNVWIWLVIIILLAGCLRFYQIEKESLWYDEGYTLETISQNDMWTTIMSRDNTPPLYYYSLKYWCSKFGFTEFGMRSFSAVFGILSVLIIFFIGKELFDVERGLVTAALMAVEMTHIMISQEARVYSLFLFTALLATLFFIKSAKNNWYWILYVLSVYLMFNTCFFAIYVVALQSLFFLLYKDSYKISSFNFFEILGIALSISAISYTRYIPIISNIIAFFKNQYPIFGINALYIVLPVSFLGLLIAYLIIKRYDLLNKFLENPYIATAILGGFLFTYFLISPYFTHPAFFIRYSIFLLPLAYIYFGMQIWRYKNYKWLFIIFVIYCLSINYVVYYKMDNKEQWKDTINFIDEDGLMLVIDGDAKPIVNYYYKGNNTVVFIRSEPLPEGYKLEGVKDYDYLYLVLSHNRFDEGYWKSAFSQYLIVKQNQFIGVEVIKYSIK